MLCGSVAWPLLALTLCLGWAGAPPFEPLAWGWFITAVVAAPWAPKFGDCIAPPCNTTILSGTVAQNKLMCAKYEYKT